MANKIRQYAKELLFGTMEEQFGLPRRYTTELLRTNLRSTVTRALHEQIYFSARKASFKIGCRKVVGVDGFHLQGYFEGILLTTVGQDANDSLYLVAYAVVDKKNTNTWIWFLKYL